MLRTPFTYLPRMKQATVTFTLHCKRWGSNRYVYQPEKNLFISMWSSRLFQMLEICSIHTQSHTARKRPAEGTKTFLKKNLLEIRNLLEKEYNLVGIQIYFPSPSCNME